MSKPNKDALKVKFNTILATFVKSMKVSMDAAKECANMAIVQFAEHDNLNWCQRFLDAMPENFSRRGAFVKWLAFHSPITIEKGKLKKDKAEDAVKFDVPGALAKPFWEFAPDNEALVILSDAEAFKRLMQGIRYFRRDNVTTSPIINKLVDDIGGLVNTAKLQVQQAGDEKPFIVKSEDTGAAQPEEAVA